MYSARLPFPFKKPGVFLWCTEFLGKGSWHFSGHENHTLGENENWCAVRQGSYMCFIFANDMDATMFALKWT